MLKATIHKPLGRPGGPGLWKHKGWQLPAYIQHIAHALIRKRGMSESRAISTAVAVVKRWAAGVGDVDEGTRAAARKALAEWEALKGRAAVAKAGRGVRRAMAHCELDAPTAAELAEIERAFSWTEALHPRGAKGTSVGGKFVKKGSGGTPPPKRTGPGGPAARDDATSSQQTKPKCPPGSYFDDVLNECRKGMEDDPANVAAREAAQKGPPTQPGRQARPGPVATGKITAKPLPGGPKGRLSQNAETVARDGLKWGGKTFKTMAEFSRWLSAHGSSIRHFKARHPGVASGFPDAKKKKLRIRKGR